MWLADKRPKALWEMKSVGSEVHNEHFEGYKIRWCRFLNRKHPTAVGWVAGDHEGIDGDTAAEGEITE